MGKAVALHFTITGQFLTQHCRSLWADEDRPDHAIKTLVTGLLGMTEAQAVLILTGAAKLTGDSKKGVMLRADKAKRSKHGNPLPTVAQMASKLIEKSKRATIPLPEPESESEEEIEEVKKVEQPKPDKLFSSRSGWISPKGDFYPCAWTEHMYLARKLCDVAGETGYGAERVLEKCGWIKITAGRVIAGLDIGVRYTDAAICSVTDWCLKWQEPFPIILKGLVSE